MAIRYGSRRRWALPAFVALVVVVVAVGALGLGLDAPAPIDYYQVMGDRSLVLGAGTGPALWVRLTSLTETATSITVTVSSVRAPVPSTESQVTEVNVVLASPLGARTVIDGNSGLEVPLHE